MSKASVSLFIGYFTAFILIVLDIIIRQSGIYANDGISYADFRIFKRNNVSILSSF
jgi:hypothetical protein